MLSVSVAVNVLLGVALLVQWHFSAPKRSTEHTSIMVDWSEVLRVFHDNPRSVIDVGLSHDRSVDVRYDGIIWLKTREPMLGDTARLVAPHAHIEVMTE